MPAKYTTEIVSVKFEPHGCATYTVFVRGPVPECAIAYDGCETVTVDVSDYGDTVVATTKVVVRKRDFGTIGCPNSASYQKAARSVAVHAFKAYIKTHGIPWKV
jgi:hypothetical protein